MVKCNIKRGSRIAVNANGKLNDITSETLLLIQQIFINIQKENPKAAEQFKLNIIGGVLDPNSPVWKEIHIDSLDDHGEVES